MPKKISFHCPCGQMEHEEKMVIPEMGPIITCSNCGESHFTEQSSEEDKDENRDCVQCGKRGFKPVMIDGMEWKACISCGGRVISMAELVKHKGGKISLIS